MNPVCFIFTAPILFAAARGSFTLLHYQDVHHIIRTDSIAMALKHYYLQHFITPFFLFLSLLSRTLSPIFPFRSNPEVAADLEVCTCSDCAGELRLGLGTQVGAERGSVPPYTSLRRFPVCVALKDLRRRRDLPRTLYVRLLVSCIFHFACGLRCPTRTGAAVPSCISLLSLLPPPQSTH